MKIKSQIRIRKLKKTKGPPSIVNRRHLSGKIYKNLRIDEKDAMRAARNAVEASSDSKFLLIMRPIGGGNYEIKISSNNIKEDASSLVGYEVKEVKRISQTLGYQKGLVSKLEFLLNRLITERQIDARWADTPNRAFENETPREYVLRGKSGAVIKALEAVDSGVPL